MAPETETDIKAREWFNSFLPKLQFEQDYYIFPGSSKPMYDKDGNQNGISIKRADIRFYSTGVTKLYEMVVEGKEYPDIEYTEDEEKQFDKNMVERFPELKEKFEDESNPTA